MTPLRGLAPIIDDRARILILGSFPSPASLAAGQYYAHPQNQFWRILGAIIGRPLAELEYGARQAALRDTGLAVWDVYGACERQGSLDAAIRRGQANDFSVLRDLAPGLQRVCFNGRTAARFERALAGFGYRVAVLPSTSPAYTLPLPEKLARWRQALA